MTPSLRGGCHPNGPATKLLFVVTQFSAGATPILRGDVVITSRTMTGDATGLTARQVADLLDSLQHMGRRDEWRIERRLRQTVRSDRRGRARVKANHEWGAYFRA